jgi:rfaE bifunctional protein nucleotidyltransferase chain/domain
MSFHDKLYNKLQNSKSIIPLINNWKNEKQKIVFTNGCFDILHRGHVEYLTKAKDLGNKLIIALNTDDSVKRLGKSPERPINHEEARMVVLSALECVDAIIFFNEDTPINLIKLILPHVLVKGSDYQKEKIVGYHEVIENGGEVETIDLVEGFSTSNILKKILK